MPGLNQRRNEHFRLLLERRGRKQAADTGKKKAANFVLRRRLNLPCVPAAAARPRGKFKNICIYQAPTGLAEQRLRLR